MESANYLETLVKNIVEAVVQKVMKNLKTVQGKRKRRRSRLCYVCRRHGHLAFNCPNQMRCGRSEHCIKVSKNRKININISDEWKKRKNDTYLDDNVDAGFLRSVKAKDERKGSTYYQRTTEMNNKCMEIRRVDISKKGNPKRVEEQKDSDKTIGMLMEINGSKSVQGTIRVSSCLNLMSMKYAKSKGLIWKCRNKKTFIGCTDDEFVGYIPGVEIVVNGVCIVQEFHVKHELPSDVILGMPWVAKTRCGFGWKDGKCYCTIRSGFDEATFVISEDPTFDETVLDKDCVNIRCVTGESRKSDYVDCEGKKNMDINKLNKMMPNSTKVINSKNVPMKSDRQDDSFEVVDNEGEAADGKANGYQYENGIGNEKSEHTELTVPPFRTSVQQNSMRTLNCMLRSKRDVRNFASLSNVSYQKVKVSGISRKVEHLVFENSIKSASRSKCNRHENAKIGMMATLGFESDESIGKNGNDSKKWDVFCIDENKLNRGPRVFEDIKRIGFFKRLYLDHMGSRLEMRKLGRIDFNESKVDSNESKLGSNELKVGPSEPKLDSSEPNLNLVHLNPNLGSFEPNLGSFEPNLGSFEPNSGSFEPNLGSFEHNLGSFEPNLVHFEPNLGSFEPNLGSFETNLGSFDLKYLKK
ncbi:hypothetical protein C2G38_2200901 [Gigaspora rosea]|uniref:CCHC-type domain-containing protein n=1 Tax=Gigaspora rosea TaxID=44941 RepID=A0A397UYN0_9GLOM|nr:hypothetical protein C2G38_2200901 [Gigaspora rosea]